MEAVAVYFTIFGIFQNMANNRGWNHVANVFREKTGLHGNAYDFSARNNWAATVAEVDGSIDLGSNQVFAGMDVVLLFNA